MYSLCTLFLFTLYLEAIPVVSVLWNVVLHQDFNISLIFRLFYSKINLVDLNYLILILSSLKDSFAANNEMSDIRRLVNLKQ